MSIATDGFGTLFEGAEGLLGTPAWATQAAWFIDPTNSTGFASNSNDGATSLTPLLTIAELARRWNLVAVAGRFQVTQAITITFLSSNASIDPDPFPVIPIRKFGLNTINVIGALTTVRTGTFTTVTARAAGQQQNVNDAAVVSWTADVGRIVTDNVSNGRFRVFKDHGSGTAEVTEPVLALTVTPPNATDAGTFPVLTQPVSGHAYTVTTPMRIRLQGLDVAYAGAPGSASNSFAWTFRNFSFGVDTSALQNMEMLKVQGTSTPGTPYTTAGFFECTFEGGLEFLACSAMCVNCWFAQPPFSNLSTVIIRAGGGANTLNAFINSASAVTIDGYFLIGGKLGDQNSVQAAQYLIVSCTAATTCANAFFGQTPGTWFRFNSAGGHYTPSVCGTVTQNWIRLSKGAVATIPVASNAWTNFFLGSAAGSSFGDFDGLSTLSNWLISSQTWDATGPIVVTVTNLDAANGAGAFGGQAINPVTATRLCNANI